MVDVYKYRLYCMTEDKYVDTWDESTPTACPNNNTHTIISGSISIIDVQIDDGPRMVDDGRPIVRADTRPLGTQTYFTMRGDDLDNGTFGDGQDFRWDFSNDDNPYDPSLVENGPTIASGFKAKRIDLSFTDPVYLKDGDMYFFDAPWGAYGNMYITVPSGNYYPNPNGTIPAYILGLSGDDMYSYATKDVFYACYVNSHFMYGDCPMGNELNAEGSQTDPVPSGWYLTALLFAPEDNTTFKGFSLFEMYRQTLGPLPGE